MEIEKQGTLAEIMEKIESGQKLTRLEEIFYLLNVQNNEKVASVSAELGQN